MKTEEINEEQKKFYAAFEEKVNDKIQAVDLAELRATSKVLKILNLKPHTGQMSLWGLLISCSNKNYFYAPPKDNTFAGLVIRKKSEDDEKDQILDLTQLENFTATLPKKSFLQFLNPENSRTISCRFTFNNENENFIFITGKKSVEFINYLNQEK